MKSLVGVLILLCLFGAAATWQDHWLGLVRGEASQRRSSEESPTHREPPGWDAVLIGGTNEPIEAASEPAADTGPTIPQPPVPATASPKTATDSRPTALSTPMAPAVTRVVVQRGESVSSLCHKHYGSSRSALVEAVARYNRLPSADSIREGQELLFPSMDQLMAPTNTRAH